MMTELPLAVGHFITAFSPRSRFVHRFAPNWTRDSGYSAASFPLRVGLASGVAPAVDARVGWTFLGRVALSRASDRPSVGMVFIASAMVRVACSVMQRASNQS